MSHNASGAVHDVIPLSPYLPAPSANDLQDVKRWQGALQQSLHSLLRRIIFRANHALQVDGENDMLNPLPLASYTVAGVPAAADWTAGVIYVSNESGGAVLAFSDGTNWRRVTDRAIIS